MRKLNDIHLFVSFCLPPGSQYKFDLSRKHKIKLEWPYGSLAPTPAFMSSPVHDVQIQVVCTTAQHLLVLSQTGEARGKPEAEVVLFGLGTAMHQRMRRATPSVYDLSVWSTSLSNTTAK